MPARISSFNSCRLVRERSFCETAIFYARYLPSGHLVFIRGTTLFAARFDVNRLELSGPPVPAVENVAVNAPTGAQFAVAANGTLAYVPGRVGSDDAPISWMNRSGKTTPLRS